MQVADLRNHGLAAGGGLQRLAGRLHGNTGHHLARAESHLGGGNGGRDGGASGDARAADRDGRPGHERGGDGDSGHRLRVGNAEPKVGASSRPIVAFRVASPRKSSPSGGEIRENVRWESFPSRRSKIWRILGNSRELQSTALGIQSITKPRELVGKVSRTPKPTVRLPLRRGRSARRSEGSQGDAMLSGFVFWFFFFLGMEFLRSLSRTAQLRSSRRRVSPSMYRKLVFSSQN